MTGSEIMKTIDTLRKDLKTYLDDIDQELAEIYSAVDDFSDGQGREIGKLNDQIEDLERELEQSEG